jgi:hypothetical protein
VEWKKTKLTVSPLLENNLSEVILLLVRLAWPEPLDLVF